MIPNKVNAKLTETLRDKLIDKKYKLKFNGVSELVQAMYKVITIHKMWDEVKGVKENIIL
jgi:hypothetical protein